jgi:hypothetical protein
MAMLAAYKEIASLLNNVWQTYIETFTEIPYSINQIRLVDEQSEQTEGDFKTPFLSIYDVSSKSEAISHGFDPLVENIHKMRAYIFFPTITLSSGDTITIQAMSNMRDKIVNNLIKQSVLPVSGAWVLEVSQVKDMEIINAGLGYSIDITFKVVT